MAYGPANPPRFPNELMKAMLVAEIALGSMVVGSAQKGPYMESAAISATLIANIRMMNDPV
jgi:hypothetical protein